MFEAPHVQARIEAAIPAAMQRITHTLGVYAVLWCGSAARGKANPYSDLDFHALVSGDYRWRANFTIEGVPVEVFHNPVRKVQAMFAEPDDACIAMFAGGRILLSHPDLVMLQAQAQLIRAGARPPQPLTEFERFALIEEVMDARAQVNDPIHVMTVLHALQRQVMPLLYARRGWWAVKRERWLDDLLGKDEEVAAELLAVLTASDGFQRQSAFERLAARATGDFVYREGSSPPQLVPAESMLSSL